MSFLCLFSFISHLLPLSLLFPYTTLFRSLIPCSSHCSWVEGRSPGSRCPCPIHPCTSTMVEVNGGWRDACHTGLAPGRADRRRGGRAQRGKRLSAALLRAQRADRRPAHLGEPAPVPAGRAAPVGAEPGRAAGGYPSGGHPQCSGRAAGRAHPDPAGLAAALRAVAGRAGRADPPAAAAAGQLHRLHRLRLSVHRPVRAGEPARCAGRARRGPAAAAGVLNRLPGRCPAQSTVAASAKSSRGRRGSSVPVPSAWPTLTTRRERHPHSAKNSASTAAKSIPFIGPVASPAARRPTIR